MQYSATQKFVKMTPRKLRLVANLVRGLPASEVVEFLPFVGKRAAGPVHKVIAAALAAAKDKGDSPDTLRVKEIQISEGPILKRWRAGARGRAKPYTRRMSHIRVVLEAKASKAEPAKKQAKTTKETAAKAAAPKAKKQVKKAPKKGATK